MNATPSVVGGQDRVRVVAVGARRGVGVTLPEQQLPVSAGTELGDLPDLEAVLAHPIRIGVTRTAELDGGDLVRRADVCPRVSGGDLETGGVATMAVVTPDAALGVNALDERLPLVGMTDDASVDGVRGHLELSLLDGDRQRRSRFTENRCCHHCNRYPTALHGSPVCAGSAISVGVGTPTSGPANRS